MEGGGNLGEKAYVGGKQRKEEKVKFNVRGKAKEDDELIKGGRMG